MADGHNSSQEEQSSTPVDSNLVGGTPVADRQAALEVEECKIRDNPNAEDIRKHDSWPVEVVYDNCGSLLTTASIDFGMAVTFGKASIPMCPIRYDLESLRKNKSFYKGNWKLQYNNITNAYEYPDELYDRIRFINDVVDYRGMGMDANSFLLPAKTVNTAVFGIGIGVGANEHPADSVLKDIKNQVGSVVVPAAVGNAMATITGVNISASTNSFIYKFGGKNTKDIYSMIDLSNFNANDFNIICINGSGTLAEGVGIGVGLNLVLIGKFKSYFHYCGGFDDFSKAIFEDNDLSKGTMDLFKRKSKHIIGGIEQAAYSMVTLGSLPFIDYINDVVKHAIGFFYLADVGFVAGSPSLSTSIIVS